MGLGIALLALTDTSGSGAVVHRGATSGRAFQPSRDNPRSATRELIDQTLREAGHRVLSTRDALEALEVVRRIRIDVLVAGVLLDGRRKTAVGELRSIQPRLRVVSICDPNDEPQIIDRGARLSSPFSLEDLREAVAASLEHRVDP